MKKQSVLPAVAILVSVISVAANLGRWLVTYIVYAPVVDYKAMYFELNGVARALSCMNAGVALFLGIAVICLWRGAESQEAESSD